MKADLTATLNLDTQEWTKGLAEHNHQAFIDATAPLWSPPQSTPKTPMPIVTAICSIPVLSALLSMPVATIVVAVAPASADICAVLGALIASVLTLIEARKKDRTIGHTISVFLGTASVGAFLPGLLMQLAVHRGWLTAETVAAFGWQAWAFAGLVLGMNAWWILHGINRWLQRRAESYFDPRPRP